MPGEPNLTGIIRRTGAHDVSCGVPAAGLQLRDDDNSLHLSILCKLAPKQSLKAYPPRTRIPAPRTSSILTRVGASDEAEARRRAGRRLTAHEVEDPAALR